MNHALQVLEYGAILERLVGQCETEMAAQEAARLQPTFDQAVVWHELQRTEQAHKLLAQAAQPSLGAVHDIVKPLQRAEKGATLGGSELFDVADALASMRAFKTFLNPKRFDYPLLWVHADHFPEAKRLEDQLFQSLEPNGDLKDSASQTLSGIRQRMRSATTRIQERIQSYTTGKNREFLSDPIYTMRDGRYVVPVKSEYRGRIRGIVHDTSGSGQTVFVEPEDVLQLGNALRELEAAEREEIVRILGELSSKVGAVAQETIRGVREAGELDLLLAKGKLGYSMKATMPEKWDGHGIKIEGGRHPLLDPEKVVPLDLSLGFDLTGLLITGPNTGGKTVAIKAVGIFALMAQSGLMLPARSIKLGPFTQVWADIGDEQSLQQSLSTFSGHIKNIAEAIRDMKKGALILFDEIGAGTDPAEGAALARSILLTLKNKGAVILASTHYGELKAFAYDTEGFQNAAMEFDAKTLRPTYRLIMGAPGASHALKIAERYGIPKEVVEQARESLSGQQQEIGQMMEKLEQAQRQARLAQGEADRRTAELKKMEERASKKLAEAEEIRKTVHAKASAVIEDALREIRLEAATVFAEFKNSGSGKDQERARAKLKDLQEVGQDFAAEFKPKSSGAKPESTPLAKGMSVKIEGYTQVGTILEEPKGNSVIVQMGPLKLTVKAADLTPVQTPTTDRAKAGRNTAGLQKAQTAHTEIHLRAMRAEDANDELERFLDEAVLAGLPQVRIVHGKGEGILRKMSQDILRRHPHIKNYRDGEPGEGGHGVTIAYLK